MREIKFHGKRVDNGEWIEGDLCHGYRGLIYISYDDDFTFACHCGEDELTSSRFFQVDPDTVGQYTGLKDKNGNEICEGDIIQTYFSFSPADAGYGVSQKPFVVQWEQGRSGFRAYKPNTKDRHLLDTIDFFEMQKNLYEVIGNIYDSPELLKE